jgi:hypothetical protein
MWSTFCMSTFSLRSFRGRSSADGVRSGGRGRLGGFIAPGAAPPVDRESRTGGSAGFGGTGAAFGGCKINNGFEGVRRILSVVLKCKSP